MYAYGNPVKYTDPSGHWVESAWDIASIGVGGVSLYYNIREGNTRDAWIDAGGLALDVGALVVPIVPGGASVAIKATRAARLANATVKSAKTIKWISRSIDVSGTIGRNVWSMHPFDRGRVIEDFIGRSTDLVQNFPVIDRFEDGIATSIKSIDLNAPSYQKPSQLRSRIKGYINTLAGWQGAQRGDIIIRGNDIESRVLELAVPPGSQTFQIEVIQELQQ